MSKIEISKLFDRRNFIKSAGLGVGAGILGMQYACKSAAPTVAAAPETPAPPPAPAPPAIQGFDQTKTDIDADALWKPVSDRKIKMGLVGFGLCGFSAAFELQNHPNVEIVAVSDLFPDRCAALAKVVNCAKTYPSLEEMVKDRSIEAIFVATDAPSHARHCIEVLSHGKHVATAVPAMWGSVEEAEKLFELVKKTGLVYAMFETSAFHDNLYAMKKIYDAGAFGEIIYSEGEYLHFEPKPLPSYNEWRTGTPPMHYPTHATAYYCTVTGGSFTEVSCVGYRSEIASLVIPLGNKFGNKFTSEIALFRTSKGGTSRMAVAWDFPGVGAENGRVYGEKGAYVTGFNGISESKEIVSKLNLKKPQLPPGVAAGGHGGSHGYLGNDFVEAILLNRRPRVDIAMALNMSVCGAIAHQSALKDGELLKIPQYKL